MWSVFGVIIISPTCILPPMLQHPLLLFVHVYEVVLTVTSDQSRSRELFPFRSRNISKIRNFFINVSKELGFSDLRFFDSVPLFSRNIIEMGL